MIISMKALIKSTNMLFKYECICYASNRVVFFMTHYMSKKFYIMLYSIFSQSVCNVDLETLKKKFVSPNLTYAFDKY